MLPVDGSNSVPTFHSAPTFHEAERQAILDALKAASGRIAGTGGAAERLGLKRTTLQNKMRRLNVSPADWSQRADKRSAHCLPRDAQIWSSRAVS